MVLHIWDLLNRDLLMDRGPQWSSIFRVDPLSVGIWTLTWGLIRTLFAKGTNISNHLQTLKVLKKKKKKSLSLLSDRPSFHEEDPGWCWGLQCSGGRAGVSQQACGGVCASLTSRPAQRDGRGSHPHQVTGARLHYTPHTSGCLLPSSLDSDADGGSQANVLMI